MTVRSPYDGEPFYCDLCGLGFGEYLACEDVCCILESEESALLRKFQHEYGAVDGKARFDEYRKNNGT